MRLRRRRSNRPTARHKAANGRLEIVRPYVAAIKLFFVASLNLSFALIDTIASTGQRALAFARFKDRTGPESTAHWVARSSDNLFDQSPPRRPTDWHLAGRAGGVYI